MVLTINSDYFPKQHLPIGRRYEGDPLRILRGNNSAFNATSGFKGLYKQTFKRFILTSVLQLEYVRHSECRNVIGIQLHKTPTASAVT
jgi:hypothetical protein